MQSAHDLIGQQQLCEATYSIWTLLGWAGIAAMIGGSFAALLVSATGCSSRYDEGMTSILDMPDDEPIGMGEPVDFARAGEVG